MAGFYLHDNDERQLGCQNVPELHCVGVLSLVARRVAVITIPTKKEHVYKGFESILFFGALCNGKGSNNYTGIIYKNALQL